MAKAGRKLRVIEVGGTPYEIGFQYGSACPEIREVIDRTYERLGLEYETAVSLVQKYIPPLEKFAPELLDELKGIAEGAKVGFEEICFLNIGIDIMDYQGGLLGGCSSFAAGSGATSNGETIIGQSIDWLPATEETMLLLKIKPKEGPQILALPLGMGCLAMYGLNSEGIGLGINLVLHEASLSNSGGVAMNALVRKVLTATNMSKAIGIAASTARISPAHPLLAILLASSEGDIVDVEMIPDDVGVVHPEKEILVHANHFETERFRSGDLMSVFSPDSYIRSKRLHTLMNRHYGELSVGVMKKLMQDHNNYPDSICRHVDKTSPPDHWFKTIVTFITNLNEQRIYIAWGNPCENEFVEYGL